jgi:hypothetical protein
MQNIWTDATSQEGGRIIIASANHVSSHMNALQALALDVPIQDLVLSYLILATLDADTLKDWETHTARPDIPLLTELITFLETRCKAFELLQNVQASKTLVATPVSPQTSGTKVSKPIHCNVVTLFFFFLRARRLMLRMHLSPGLLCYSNSVTMHLV